MFVWSASWPAQGLAQPLDPDPDGIGVYFDSGATMIRIDVPQYAIYHAYVVATNISCDGLQAFEFTFEMAGAEIVTQATTFQGTNFGAPPEFIVGTGTPLPYADAIILVDFTLFPLSDDRTDFYLSPLSTPSIEGVCCYADALDDMHLVALGPLSGDWLQPVAAVNRPPDPGAAEEKSWGEVKNLFR